jgi:hypothetical protein
MTTTENRENFETVMLLIKSVKPKFSRDGNMYCFLLGENLQDGICGFGKTGWGAALDFYYNFSNETTHGEENNAVKKT